MGLISNILADIIEEVFNAASKKYDSNCREFERMKRSGSYSRIQLEKAERELDRQANALSEDKLQKVDYLVDNLKNLD